MIALIFSVCMIDQPSRCKEEKLNFDAEHVTQAQCFQNGQMAMAQWVGEHPNWIIKNWRCSPADQTAEKI